MKFLVAPTICMVLIKKRLLNIARRIGGVYAYNYNNAKHNCRNQKYAGQVSMPFH
jgi:hypothetical protein